MNYAQAVLYLNSFFNFERVSNFSYSRAFNLKRMKTLLRLFNHPERSYKIVLVAGTKGKGSTANFLYSLLSAHSLCTGLYTSPHLIDFRERMRVLGKWISKSELAQIVSDIRHVIHREEKRTRKSAYFTFFEISTLVAVLYFARQKVDWAVFEVGMGGRLDATNALHQTLSVFTLIGLDHEEYLGKTVRLIAGEKAAILKPGMFFVSANQTKEAESVIRAYAKKVRAKGFFSGGEFRYQIRDIDTSGSLFDFKMNRLKLRGCQIRLPGTFQVENAALAIAALFLLSKKHRILIAEERVKKGLFQANWPGRFEIIRNTSNRMIILDGAHNTDSIKALTSNIKRIFPDKRVATIFGISREKNLSAILPILRKRSDTLIAIQSTNDRAQIQKKVVETAIPCFEKVIPASSTSEALRYLRNFLAPGTIGLVTGSLFLVGEVREILKR